MMIRPIGYESQFMARELPYSRSLRKMTGAQLRNVRVESDFRQVEQRQVGVQVNRLIIRGRFVDITV